MRMQSPLGGFFFLFLGATAAWAQQQPTVKATTLLKTTTTITGQKLEYPGKNPQVTATVVEIPPGVDVGWHEHPNIRYVYVIERALTRRPSERRAAAVEQRCQSSLVHAGPRCVLCAS
jgi:hypothetical protein